MLGGGKDPDALAANDAGLYVELVSDKTDHYLLDRRRFH